MAGRISMGTRREITAAVVDRYRSAGRMDKGRILDELCAVTGWHRKHAVRALASRVGISPEARRRRSPTYGATIRDALVALWLLSFVADRQAKLGDDRVARKMSHSVIDARFVSEGSPYMRNER